MQLISPSTWAHLSNLFDQAMNHSVGIILEGGGKVVESVKSSKGAGACGWEGRKEKRKGVRW